MPINRSIHEIEREGNARFDYSDMEQIVITLSFMSLLILVFMSA